MAVPSSKRGESPVQFLETARKLEAFTLRQCMKLPKRYTFYISQELFRLSAKIYDEVKSANSVFPANQHEAQVRRDHFTEANCAVQSMISQLEVAFEVLQASDDEHKPSDKDCEEWMRMLLEEAQLLSAIKKSDKERYKSLPSR